MEELAKHSYSLVISRKQYQEVGWITPRFVECVALDTMPICDYTYDKFNHFNHFPKVIDGAGLQQLISNCETYPSIYNSILKHCKDVISKNADTFKNIVMNLVGGYEQC